MSSNKPSLSELDYLIIALIAVAWLTLSAVLFYVVPSPIICVLGAICSLVSISFYVYLGGLKGLQPEEEESRNSFGSGNVWNSVRPRTANKR